MVEILLAKNQNAVMVSAMKSAQSVLKAHLERSGIAYKSVEVYGRQVVVTAFSADASAKWHQLLNHICAKVRVVETVESARENMGTNLKPTMVKAWLIGGMIA